MLRRTANLELLSKLRLTYKAEFCTAIEIWLWTPWSNTDKYKWIKRAIVVYPYCKRKILKCISKKAKMREQLPEGAGIMSDSPLILNLTCVLWEKQG